MLALVCGVGFRKDNSLHFVHFVIQAFGTDAMTENCIRVHAYVFFEWMSVVVLGANFLAVHANREQTFQALDTGQRFFQFGFLAHELAQED